MFAEIPLLIFINYKRGRTFLISKLAFLNGRRFSTSVVVPITWILGYSIGILMLFRHIDSLMLIPVISSPSISGIFVSAVFPVLLAVVFIMLRMNGLFAVTLFFRAVIHGFSFSASSFWESSSSSYMLSQTCGCFLMIFAGMILCNNRSVYRTHYALSIVFAMIIICLLDFYFIP